MSWWAFTQVVVDIDVAINHGQQQECIVAPLMLLNSFGILVSLLLAIGGLHLLNADAIKRMLPWHAHASKINFRGQFQLPLAAFWAKKPAMKSDMSSAATKQLVEPLLKTVQLGPSA